VSAFQSIAKALAAGLTASPALASGNVKANPTRHWERDVQSAIGVRMVKAQRAGGTNCGEVWSCEYAFDIEARGQHGKDPADAVDALLSAVASRVALLNLAPLGVVERLPEASIDWLIEAADTPLARASYSITLAVHVADDFTVPI
jgi:hypothetical protein